METKELEQTIANEIDIIHITKNYQQTLTFLWNQNLIQRNPACYHMLANEFINMSLISDPEWRDNFYWRCWKCRKKWV